MLRIYINTEYKDKDDVKLNGGNWDNNRKMWYGYKGDKVVLKYASFWRFTSSHTNYIDGDMFVGGSGKRKRDRAEWNAIDSLTQRNVGAKDARKQDTNRYTCPSCNAGLIVNQGLINKPFYSHYTCETMKVCAYYEASDRSGGETFKHLNGKMTLKTMLENGLVTVSTKCQRCFELTNNIINAPLPSQKLCLEYRFKLDGVLHVPDIAFVDEDNNVLNIFEILNSNRTTHRPEPWYEIRASEIANVEDITKPSVFRCVRERCCAHCESIEKAGIDRCLKVIDLYKTNIDRKDKHDAIQTLLTKYPHIQFNRDYICEKNNTRLIIKHNKYNQWIVYNFYTKQVWLDNYLTFTSSNFARIIAWAVSENGGLDDLENIKDTPTACSDPDRVMEDAKQIMRRREYHNDPRYKFYKKSATEIVKALLCPGD